MDLQNIDIIIKNYIENFSTINIDEVYKWQAVQRFQEKWDINARNFPEMLDESLSLTKNLMDSRNHLPRTMITQLAVKQPANVRECFKLLFDESIDLFIRIDNFKDSIEAINQQEFPGKNDYNDMRNIMVYLTLKYPDKYYFYKWSMFHEIVALLDYPHTPIRGRNENINHFFIICEQVRSRVVENKVILELHHSRLNNTEYKDESYHILVQDVIYAATQKIEKLLSSKMSKLSGGLERTLISISSKKVQPSLKGNKVDWEKKERENREIGLFGEKLVLLYEANKLKKAQIDKQPQHISRDEGDGCGYDILSYDEFGNEIYIEVKTTRSGYKTGFYISENERKCSAENAKKYFLYRVYDYDFSTNSAKFFVLEGNLSSLCINPLSYKVAVEKSNQ